MVNVKSYDDGDRKIIVIENCTGELRKKVSSFLLDLYGLEMPSIKVKGLEPLPVKKEEKIPDTKNLKADTKEGLETSFHGFDIKEYRLPIGTFKGILLEDALMQGGISAAIEASKIANREKDGVKDAVINRCKKYLLKDVYNRTPNNASPNEIKIFFDEYEAMIQNGIEQILNMQGYPNKNVFLESAELDVLQQAYEALLKSLVERLVA